MPGKQIVTAPDGERWQVGRRWPTRSIKPRWRRRRRDEDARRDGDDLGDWLPGVPSLSGLDDIAVLVVLVAAVAVVILLFGFVILPLLGLAVELALLLAVFASGLFGRVVLRRP